MITALSLLLPLCVTLNPVARTAKPTRLTDGAAQLLPRPAGGTPLTVSQLVQTARPSDPNVSPDGTRVAFTVEQNHLEDNTKHSDVYLRHLPDGTASAFTHDGHSGNGRWSPDGKLLLVTSQREGDGSPQLWLYEVDHPEKARRLTSLWGGADGPVFSHDAKWVVFQSQVYPDCSLPQNLPTEDRCNRERAGKMKASGVQARVVDHLFARHWSEWTDGKRKHVFSLSLEDPKAVPRDLTPGDEDWPTWRMGFPEDLAVTRDNQVIVSHKRAATEAWSTNSDLYAVPIRGGVAKNLTADNPGDDASPLVSPDGTQVAYRSQAKDGSESDLWRLKVLDLATGRGRTVAELSDDVDTFRWMPDGAGWVVATAHQGQVRLQGIRAEGGREAWIPHGVGDDFDLTPKGDVVTVFSGFTRPPELFMFRRDGKLSPLTSLNEAAFAKVDLGPAPEELWVRSTDGTPVQSFLLRPPGLAPDARAPLMVLIHGGPQGHWGDSWGLRWNPALFAARGAVVLAVNPRGSTGYGVAFEAGVTHAWGGAAYQDILKSVDAAEALPFVERGRTCAAGGSYGGYIINWMEGHTQRFRCLVSHDGTYELNGMYNATEELWFMEHEFGIPWLNPAVMQKWSPSSYASAFHTPMLVVQGELDFRVPGEQGLGMFTALQRQGVESRLLWFPDEGHWVLKPKNSALWWNTVLDWVDSHRKQVSGKRSEEHGLPEERQRVAPERGAQRD